MRYSVKGVNEFKGEKFIIKCSDKKEAVKIVLNLLDFKFSSVTELTSREDEILLFNGISPISAVDFIVKELDTDNSVVSSFHINL